MKHVLFYELAEAAMPLAQEHLAAHGDPFLLHGVVGAHRVREWDEILQP